MREINRAMLFKVFSMFTFLFFSGCHDVTVINNDLNQEIYVEIKANYPCYYTYGRIGIGENLLFRCKYSRISSIKYYNFEKKCSIDSKEINRAFELSKSNTLNISEFNCAL